MWLGSALSVLTLLVAGLFLAPHAFAQAPVTLSAAATQSTAQSVLNYWTPERLASARPMPLPGAAVTSGSTRQAAPSEPGVSGPGHPGANVKPDLGNILYAPAAEAEAQDGVEPEQTSNIAQPFTSARLVPNADADGQIFYPNRINGKLFFTIPGQGNFICSATVQRPRIITTAGHCVHKGSGGGAGFFTNWLFIPAFKDGAAPYGQWVWAFVITTGTWAGGGGGVPNAADYAIIELRDRTSPPCFPAFPRIGSCVGFAGFQTGSFFNEHITAIGYPGNLDSAQKAHRVDAEPFLLTNNTLQIGSDMRGGSSGGGWFQNFGEFAVGQPTPNALNTGTNRLRSVTSYGPISQVPKYQGGSIFDSRFISILNTACAHRAGNC
jgi:hypothetical protein